MSVRVALVSMVKELLSFPSAKQPHRLRAVGSRWNNLRAAVIPGD
jgi:hypothetical protein